MGTSFANFVACILFSAFFYIFGIIIIIVGFNWRGWGVWEIDVIRGNLKNLDKVMFKIKILSL